LRRNANIGGLFPDIITDPPSTQAIKYTGSKLKLLPHILSLAKRVNATNVFDGFSGSTRVSQAFAKADYRVYSNDAAIYSKIFNTAYLLNEKEPKEYQKLIDHLNSLEPIDGWFTENYGGDDSDGKSIGANGLKSPWQKKNTRKLDAIREEIDRLKLDQVTSAVCVTSLILALDRVDSTLGHYASYLSDWSPRSYNDLRLEPPKLWVNTKKNMVMNDDVFDAIDKLPASIDLAYFDPPYGSNNEKMPPSRVRYASYYHIWTTICLNDKPKLFGKAKRRIDSSDAIAASVFEEFRKNESGKFICLEAIERLIKQINSNYIILSYSSGGRATANELYDVLSAYGAIVDINKINYNKNVMSAMKWTNNWTKDIEEKNYEYLFLMKKK
jgi:adenine-specific DNA-methyltransferase